MKAEFPYTVFMYDASHVGITATGDEDLNELYPNDRQPPEDEPTCLELYLEYLKNPADFEERYREP